MLLRDDPQAREAMLGALAAIGAARTDYAGPGPDAADPLLAEFAGEVAGIEIDEHDAAMLELIAALGTDEEAELLLSARRTRFMLAALAALFLEELEVAGGSPAALLARITTAVSGGEARS